MIDNGDLIQKADMQLADLSSGGLLQEAQAQTFLRLAIKKAALLPICRTVPMKSPKQLVEKIRFGSRVLKAGTSGVALAQGDRVKPDLSMVELDAELFKGELHIPVEAVEDNIERGDFPQTIQELMAEAISRDLDDLAWNGDTASTDPFLAKMNGVRALISSNTVDAVGVRTNKTLLRDMLKTMPVEAQDRPNLRFITSVNAETDYRDSLAERATAVGDRFLEGDLPVMYSGVRMVSLPVAPENLSGTNTEMVLIDPKNIYVGFWRGVKFELDKDISAGVLKVVVTLRMALELAEETFSVKGENVLVA